jgi:hypothetical protein
MGLVKSLARPGGNLTGLTFVTVELERHAAPQGRRSYCQRAAVLWNPNNSINKLELRAVVKVPNAKLTLRNRARVIEKSWPD